VRIVDVSAFYTPQGGGVRTYVDRKLTAAAAAGHEMIVIAPGNHDHVEERGPGQIVQTIVAPKLPVDRRYNYFGDEPKLHAALDAWRPDFVESSSPWASASMVARWRSSVPRSLVMHADPLSAYAYRWFGGFASIETIDRRFERFWAHLRRLDQRYEIIVSASENLSARLRAGGLKSVVTMPMGVEPGIFTPAHRDPVLRAAILQSLELPEEATLLLGVGRYSPEKRWDMVIDAAIAAGHSRPIGLLLIGDGRIRQRLLKRVSGSPHVRIGVPVKNRDELARIMASADALVHGCEAETFCMVAAEARASGLPLIVPDRGGAADHAVAGRDLLYRAADAASLREAVAGFQRHDGPLAMAPVRTMDAHFDDLFRTYAGLIDSAAPVRPILAARG
jgi:alpha-1,6-mannosyltransferase